MILQRIYCGYVVLTPHAALCACDAAQYKEESYAYRVVLLYFGLWEPPPNAKDAATFYERVLIPKLTLNDLKHSLSVRGM